MNRQVIIPCLSLWERWPNAERTERENEEHTNISPSQSPSVTASPKGGAKEDQSSYCLKEEIYYSP